MYRDMAGWFSLSILATGPNGSWAWQGQVSGGLAGSLYLCWLLVPMATGRFMVVWLIIIK